MNRRQIITLALTTAIICTSTSCMRAQKNRKFAALALIKEQIKPLAVFNDAGPLYPRDVADIPNAVPKKEPLSRYGNQPEYSVNGKTYKVLKTAKGYHEKGKASWYGTKFHGRMTSSREPYDIYAMTAASKVLPIPSYVRVTNLENNKTVVVKVNDRGPFHDDRILDLSYAAATKLGYAKKGTALVEIAVIDPEEYEHTIPKPDAHEPLFLQVGVFREKARAENLSHQISTITDVDVQVAELNRETGLLYRVQIGPFKNIQAEQATKMSLYDNGLGVALPVHS